MPFYDPQLHNTGGAILKGFQAGADLALTAYQARRMREEDKRNRARFEREAVDEERKATRFGWETEADKRARETAAFEAKKRAEEEKQWPLTTEINNITMKRLRNQEKADAEIAAKTAAYEAERQGLDAQLKAVEEPGEFLPTPAESLNIPRRATLGLGGRVAVEGTPLAQGVEPLQRGGGLTDTAERQTHSLRAAEAKAKKRALAMEALKRDTQHERDIISIYRKHGLNKEADDREKNLRTAVSDTAKTIGANSPQAALQYLSAVSPGGELFEGAALKTDKGESFRGVSLGNGQAAIINNSTGTWETIGTPKTEKPTAFKTAEEAFIQGEIAAGVAPEVAAKKWQDIETANKIREKKEAPDKAADAFARTEELRARAADIDRVKARYKELYDEINDQLKDMPGNDPDAKFERARLSNRRNLLREQERNEIAQISRRGETAAVSNVSETRTPAPATAPRESPAGVRDLTKPAAAAKPSTPPAAAGVREVIDPQGNVWEADATGTPIRMKRRAAAKATQPAASPPGARRVGYPSSPPPQSEAERISREAMAANIKAAEEARKKNPRAPSIWPALGGWIRSKQLPPGPFRLPDNRRGY